jgi:predicted dehydrogenase
MNDVGVNLALIGCGFHAKRIYVKYLRDRLIPPRIIIDVLSNEEDVMRVIHENGWSDTRAYFVNPKDSYDAFSDNEQKEILSLFTMLRINKAIISTPPEVHTPYAELCLEGGIKILVDKPLSAPRNISSGNSQELLDDLKTLLQYDKGDNIIIQCQRRRHDGYKYIKKLIQEVGERYGIQPHFIDIYHSDGRWDFPDEIAALKNHPYTTGYGKLLHSGYHFVDLLAFLTDNATYDSFDLFSYKHGINDFKTQIPDDFYKTNFNIDNKHTFTNEGYGEIDTYSLIQLKNDNKVKTTASISLLHSGFTRRSWSLARTDLYKGNGRLRHERVNIQIGPLMNIQVHSYQSTEVHDAQPIGRGEFGGLEHFDIHIFRNADIIGGKPYELVTIESLEDDAKIDLGQNENARYQLVDDFLADRESNSAISSHIRTNILLASIAKSMHENQQVSRNFRL